VIFPGVGAMPDCIRALESRGLVDLLKEVAETKPMLGICLGLQALFGPTRRATVTAWAFCRAGSGALPQA
jgi:glutamine amidotransferase